MQITLFGLALALPLGCDPSEGPEPDGLADDVAALELSPSQNLLEVGEADAIAFDAVEPFDLEAEAEVQASGAGCTLLRPVGWHKSGTNCVEYYKAPGSPADQYPMSHGQSFTVYSGYSGGGLGSGSAQVSCNNGSISIQAISCSSGGGVIQ